MSAGVSYRDRRPRMRRFPPGKTPPKRTGDWVLVDDGGKDEGGSDADEGRAWAGAATEPLRGYDAAAASSSRSPEGGDADGADAEGGAGRKGGAGAKAGSHWSSPSAEDPPRVFVNDGSSSWAERAGSSGGAGPPDAAKATAGGAEAPAGRSGARLPKTPVFPFQRPRLTRHQRRIARAPPLVLTSGPNAALPSYELEARAPHEYAVVELGGHQVVVEPGRDMETNRIDAEVGSILRLQRVLLVKRDRDVFLGRPHLATAFVSIVVLEHKLGEVQEVFKFKRKKHYKRYREHRQALTAFRVLDIDVGQEDPLPSLGLSKEQFFEALEQERRERQQDRERQGGEEQGQEIDA